MDFYLWDHIKSKVYVKNYEYLADQKSSIAAAFREVSTENVLVSLRSMEKRLKLVVERKGGAHRKKKYFRDKGVFKYKIQSHQELISAVLTKIAPISPSYSSFKKLL